MNHNGVISLPTDGSSQYNAGAVVALGSAGEATLTTAAGTGIGVVLHDVKADETARPVDIQLFSAGGIVNLLVDETATAIAVGDKVGYENGEHQCRKNGNTTVGFALEASTAVVDDGSIIQVIL